MRRREIFLDLGELGTMPLSRFSNSSSSSTISPSPSSLLDTTYLLAEKAASADKEISALFYEELEEVLSSDNSIAHRPSLDEDDSGLTADAALRLDLALELLECISWKAEQLGAFGNRRDAV